MRKLKGIISLLLVIFISVFFVACNDVPSGGDTGSDTSSGTTESSTESSDTESSGDSSDSGSETEEGELTILTPSGEVFPYLDNVKQYLQAGADANVRDYAGTEANPYSAVKISWKNTYKNVSEYKVEYSVNEDMTDCETVILSASKEKYNVYNLLKATNYYVRVTALLDSGESKIAETSFRTTDLGPRVLNVGGIYNVRDLGGYLLESGERTLQGKIFRGGALSKSTDTAYDYVKLNDKGAAFMSETLGIKTDFDLRNAQENLGLIESPIPGAKLEYYACSSYSSAFTDKEVFAKVFSALSDETRYPVYFHCTGGADRTGTIAFLLNALVGVDELTCIQDYELTSFSIYGTRDARDDTGLFKPFLEKLKTFPGDTLAEKTENYMLSIGVSETEIYNIRAIMLGKPTKLSVFAQKKFVSSSDNEYKIELGKEASVGKVVINGKEVEFTVNGKIIAVAKSAMPDDMQDGMISGSVTIDGTSYDFSFEYDGTKRISAVEVPEGGITLNSENKRASGTTVIGYDGAIAELNVKSVVDDGAGGTFFFIGSYGLYYRGGCFRVATISGGNYAEASPRVMTATGIPAPTFDAGVKFGMSVKIKNDDTVTLTVYINGKELTEIDLSRKADEIASENATFTVEINPSCVTSFEIGE